MHFLERKAQILPNFVHKGPNDNESALFSVIALCQTSYKPLPEKWWPSLPKQFCITWPQSVKNMAGKSQMIQFFLFSIYEKYHVFNIDTKVYIK